MSNFDDFDPLRAEVDVSVRFVDRIEEIDPPPDLIILPGTKTTLSDLEFLRMRGLAKRISELAHTGVPVLGICGGYQMLGSSICDPLHVESEKKQVGGLDLLPIVTTFAAEKQTVRARGNIAANRGLFAEMRGLAVGGYEIHMGFARTLLNRSFKSKSAEKRLASLPTEQWTPAAGSPEHTCTGYSTTTVCGTRS